MNRYLLKFCKIGNMRFISHLDLGRLFKRAIRKGNIKVAFSNGYNPHELINIVQPLSLGYESICEYFEIDTLIAYDPEDLLTRLNSAMPEGIRFTACRETERRSKNMSFYSQRALYEAVFPCGGIDDVREKLEGFLGQSSVFIRKKEKKTGKLVDKDVKDYIYSVRVISTDEKECKAELELRCASNETLNPGKLLDSFFEYCGADIPLEKCRFRRTDLLGCEADGELKTLFDLH